MYYLGVGLEAVGDKKNFQGDKKGFSSPNYANEDWFKHVTKFNKDNEDKVKQIKEDDAYIAAENAEMTAQIINAQINLNQMNDAMMNEVNSMNSYYYNPIGEKSWFNGESFDVNNSDKRAKLNFADTGKLNNHFSKHGGEFGVYSNSNDYLSGANDLIQNGIKVQYNYKGELRIGYVKFMKNSSLINPEGVPIKSFAKFEFVGTNSFGEITTYHVESKKTFWKMLNNGENIKIINPLE